MAENFEKAAPLPLSQSLSEGGSPPPFKLDKKALMRKIDFHLLPALCILYVFSFLDRVNISNAAIFGLKDDLHLDGVKYNTALTIFFIPYILFEIPANWLLKKLKPHVWLPSCMFMFGLVTTLQGLVHSYGGLLTTRFFLGVFEAGMFPGCFYLIAMWYRREEAQKRLTFFFNSTALAGAFGGLLASGIGKMDGMQGFRGWRWIFILEGACTCVVAIILFFVITDFPEEATFLTEQEREFVKGRLQDDVGRSAREEKMTIKDIANVFKDYKVFLGAFMFLGGVVPGYAYAYFAPTIVRSYGYGPIETQLRSVPPWVVTFALAMTIAAISDHVKHRYIFTIIPLAIAITGATILLTVHHHRDVQYAALFLFAGGTYSAMPMVACWFNTNLAGHHRRAVGTAFQVGFGNIGGIIATYSFLDKDKPYYRMGYKIVIGFMVFSVLSCTAYWAACKVENRRREKEVGGEKDEEGGKALGDLWIGYRYMT